MTTVTFQLTDAIERKLQARAKDRGQSLGTVALEILEKELAEPTAPTNPNDLPYDVWQARFQAMLDDLPRVDVVVDDSRETIYEGRGE